MKYIIENLPIIQMALSIVLIILIIMQQNDESLGGSFGGSDSFDTVKRTRRGAEKKIFNLTIWIAVFFVISSILNFLYR